MGTGQEVDDDGLIKSLLRCHEYKRRARKQVFHNKTFYKHIMKVHIMRQDIRKEIDSINEQKRLDEQLREERRQIELQQEQQQIEYQNQLEFQQYQNQLAFEQQQQQQEFAFQQEHQQQQPVQHSGYQVVQNQMPSQLSGYQDHYQFQYQQVEPQQQFQAQQDYYQKPMNYMQYSHDYGYEETSVKLEHRISSLESLETPPPSDLPSHPPPSLSSISSSSFTDNTSATLSSIYNVFAPTETPTPICADQTTTRGSRASSGFGSSAGSSQSPKNACSPPNQLTLKFPMQLPHSAAADVDIMRRNLWLMIVRKEIPQARKRKMSFKDQKRSKAKTMAQRTVGHIKEFRRRISIKAEKMSKLLAIVNEVQQDRVQPALV